MTTEELIIGHFEGTLSAGESAELREVLSASPDARNLFENHEALHSLLRADVAALVPGAPLASRTLEAALATPSETVTETVGRWGFGQIAAGFGTLVLLVGGTLVATRSSDPVATPVSTPAPVVAPAYTAPTPVVPNPPVVVEPQSAKVERTTAPGRTVQTQETRKTAGARTPKVEEKKKVPIIGQPDARFDKPIRFGTPPKGH